MKYEIPEKEDKLLTDLRSTGQRLSELIKINDEDKNTALKELRRECWKR